MNLKNQITYLNNYNKDMFDDCYVPDGLEFKAVRGSIIMRCGLLTPLYSEPETQRAATQQFFFENQWNFIHLINIVRAEYSPIENVDEYTNETTKRQKDLLHKSNESGTYVINETNKNIRDESVNVTSEENRTKSNTDTIENNNNESKIIENTVSAENISTYQPDNKTTESNNKTYTENKTANETDNATGKESEITKGSITETKSGNNTDSKNINSNESEGEDLDFERRRHGNIGVTTNFQLISGELELIQKFNIYKKIADLYANALMLQLFL